MKTQSEMPNTTTLPPAEAASLQREIALRILVQNLQLIVSVLVFAALAITALTSPEGAWLVAAVHGSALLALALQWCHSGVRTAQIKRYLLAHDPAGKGWESWLKVNRPAKLLGSRWFVSTKGVFIGLGAAMLCLAALLEQEPQPIVAILAITLVAAMAWFLLTNNRT